MIITVKIQDGGDPLSWKSWNRHISTNKKLSCRKETARRFVSSNISLSHSRTLMIIRN